MAKKQTNKTLTIFLPVALVIAGVILFVPGTPKKKYQPGPYYQQNAITNTTTESTTEPALTTTNAITTESAVTRNGETESESWKTEKSTEIERRIRRDIFSLYTEPAREIIESSGPKTKKTYSYEEESKPRRVRPDFDIKGIMIADNNIRSIVTGSGKILRENEELKGYKIQRIEKAKVILISDDKKDIVTVKVWEE